MKNYTFLDILQGKIEIEGSADLLTFDKIEIPMIQRDYAQGRENEKEIRNRFLDAIFKCLTKTNAPILNMDFIYGSVVSKGEKTSFVPLDGQQRLTTLFLLYWYLGLRELEDEEWNNIKKHLSKFSYETRASSRRFCENLVSKANQQEIFKSAKVDNRATLSERIKDLPWFYSTYERDPTVKAMLTMLDDINKRCNEVDNETALWEKLAKLKFFILPLKGLGMSEELYVKMNARGKQLTDFENLKADLVKWMKDPEKNKYSDSFLQTVVKEMQYHLAISQKIDTTWLNFFWKYCRNNVIKVQEVDRQQPEEGSPDLLFYKTIYRYFTNKFIISSSLSVAETEINPGLRLLLEEGNYQNFNVFEELLKKRNMIPEFEKFINSLIINWVHISEEIKPVWSEEDWNFLGESITQPGRVVFHAISIYLERHTYESDRFKKWMRVAWNIIENTDISGVSAMIGAMKLIDELAQHSDIYGFLSNDNAQIRSDSSKDAILEEKMKAAFITKNPDWEKSFITAESHPFFRGSVGSLISEGIKISEFDNRYKTAAMVFDRDGVNSDFRSDGHIFLRALISRFSDKSVIPQNFTDKDESERYLKRLLSKNETVSKAVREWFDLPFSALKDKLSEEVQKNSQIPGWSDNTDSEKKRIRRAHEALYKCGPLQDWMQDNKAYRFSWSGCHMYISRPRSRYDWVQLDSIRNNAIYQLTCHGFAAQTVNIEGTIYYTGVNIELFGEILNKNIKITFDNQSTLKIEKKENSNEWISIKEYNYVEEDDKLLELITIENLQQLLC